MSNIIEFPRERKASLELFTCNTCGGARFYLHASGYVECTDCHDLVGTLDELLEEVNDRASGRSPQ